MGIRDDMYTYLKRNTFILNETTIVKTGEGLGFEPQTPSQIYGDVLERFSIVCSIEHGRVQEEA